MVIRKRVRWIARLGMLSLIALTALLAACGQTSASSKNIPATATPASRVALTATPTGPIDVPPPYAFPKQWSPAPDGQDLPQATATIGSFAFAPSSSMIGYFCVASSDATDTSNSAAMLPFVSTTSDGGASWGSVSSSPFQAKTLCQVFIDQTNPRDVFVAAGNGSDPNTLAVPLFRSQDGGVTWRHINQPTIQGASTSIVGLAVVQTRIIAMIGINGQAGPAVSTLYASDDGGQTWKQLKLIVNGQTLQMSQLFWSAGSTIYIEASASSCQGCGTLRMPVARRDGHQPLSQPFSSEPVTPNLYFKSNDGGRSWLQIATPVTNLANLSVAHSADGAMTYLIGTSLGAPNQPANVNIAYYSKNGGASWILLPTLAGVENGYPDPGSLGAFGTWVLPDGSVITTAFHTEGTHYGGDAGAFLLRPSDASPTWQPLIRSMAGGVQIVPTSGGMRVWGLTVIPGVAGGQLEYFDLP